MEDETYNVVVEVEGPGSKGLKVAGSGELMLFTNRWGILPAEGLGKAGK